MTLSANDLELLMSLVFILELNMMLDIDFHVPALPLLMDKKSNFKVPSYKTLLIKAVVAQWI